MRYEARPQGDGVAVDVLLHAPYGTNALGGTLRVRGWGVEGVSTDSALKALWLTAPAVACGEEACDIRFDGMIPGGMQGTAKLFVLTGGMPSSGAEVELLDAEAYLNDGEGTAVAFVTDEFPSGMRPSAGAASGPPMAAMAFVVVSLAIVSLIAWRLCTSGGRSSAPPSRSR